MQKSKPFENFKNVIIIYKISLFQFIKYNCFVYKLMKGSQREGTNLFRKKPLGRRLPVNEQTHRVGEFSTTTSGTKRERGFVGIDSFLREPFVNLFLYPLIFEY